MKALLPLLGLLLLAMGRPDAALAAPDNEPTPAFIEERVEDILSKPPFGTTRETYTYRYRWDEEEEVEDEGEPLDLDFSWLEWLGDLFGWLNGAAGGGGLVIRGNPLGVYNRAGRARSPFLQTLAALFAAGTNAATPHFAKRLVWQRRAGRAVAG